MQAIKRDGKEFLVKRRAYAREYNHTHPESKLCKIRYRSLTKGWPFSDEDAGLLVTIMLLECAYCGYALPGPSEVRHQQFHHSTSHLSAK